MKGVCYIAYGWRAVKECGYSIESLRRHEPDLPIAVIGECGAGHSVQAVPFDDNDSAGRWAKVNLDRLSPFHHTLYLDADTRIHQPVGSTFGVLQDGWDVAIAYSPCQGGDSLWHVGEGERLATLEELGYEPLQLQGGVFGFRKCPAVAGFFDRWRAEWERWKGQDQAALLRAMAVGGLRVWMLGRDWNGGEIIEHRYGAARER